MAAILDPSNQIIKDLLKERFLIELQNLYSSYKNPNENIYQLLAAFQKKYKLKAVFNVEDRFQIDYFSSREVYVMAAACIEDFNFILMLLNTDFDDF